MKTDDDWFIDLFELMVISPCIGKAAKSTKYLWIYDAWVLPTLFLSCLGLGQTKIKTVEDCDIDKSSIYITFNKILQK